MSSIRSVGSLSATANNVQNPTTLTPGLPATRQNDDVLLLLTCCRSATPTVATPSGWTQLLNITGTNGRIALFARVVDGTESAPSVTWSGLTTGTNGTPAIASIAAVTDLRSAVASLLDVAGAISNQAASTTVAAGGAAITTLTAGAMVLVISVRLDDAGTWATLGVSDGVTWAKVDATATTTSGADMAMEWQFGDKATAGSVAAKSFSLSSASSFASSGVMIALKPVVLATKNAGISSPGKLGSSVSVVSPSPSARISWAKVEVPFQATPTVVGGEISPGRVGATQAKLIARSAGATSPGRVGSIEARAIVKASGITSAARIGSSQNAGTSKSVGITSAITIGAARLIRQAKSGGVISPGLVGSPKNIVSNTPRRARVSWTQLSVPFIASIAKTAGPKSSARIGGSGTGFVAPRTSGIVSTGTIGSSKKSSFFGEWSTARSFVYTTVRFPGLSSGTIFGATRTIRHAKSVGPTAIARVGASNQNRLYAKSAGISSSALIGQTKAASGGVISKSAGIISAARIGAVESKISVKSAGIVSAALRGQIRTTSQSRNNGISSSALIGQTRASSFAKSLGITSQAVFGTGTSKRTGYFTSALVGTTKAVTLTKSSGISSTARLGGSGIGSQVFIKATGIASSAVQGASRTTRVNASIGLVSAASSGGVAQVLIVRSAGLRAAVAVGFTFNKLISRNVGISSTSNAGSSRLVARSTTIGIQSSSAVGAQRLQLATHNSGIHSTASMGGKRPFANISGIVSSARFGSTVEYSRFLTGKEPHYLVAVEQEETLIIGASTKVILVSGENKLDEKPILISGR